MPRKPSTGLTKKSSKASEKRRKKAIRKEGQKSATVHGRGRYTAAEKKAHSDLLSGKKRLTGTSAEKSGKFKEMAEKEYGLKKESLKQRTRSTKGGTARAKSPKAPKSVRSKIRKKR